MVHLLFEAIACKHQLADVTTPEPNSLYRRLLEVMVTECYRAGRSSGFGMFACPKL